MRFTDNNNGTVTDTLTGLVWPKNADTFGRLSWDHAKAAVAALADGQHGLSDGSAQGDWRLPSIEELMSLIADDQDPPSLPSGHPFYGCHTNLLVHSDAGPCDMFCSWSMLRHSAYRRYDYYYAKSRSFHVWPVRRIIGEEHGE